MHKFAIEMQPGKTLSTGSSGAIFTTPTSISGAVSPAARATARISPVNIAGTASGSVTCQSVSARVAPNASEPWRSAAGMRDSPSSVATITTGSVNSASVSEAHSRPGVPKVGLGSAAV